MSFRTFSRYSYLGIALACAAASGCGDKEKEAPKIATPKAETKAETKPESKPESKTEAKAETKPESKPESKPETKADAAPAFVCKVESGKEVVLDGPCSFKGIEGNGSFVVRKLDGSTMGGATDITVSIVNKGVAEVRGLTKDGINSRWGEAKRSAKDPACWEGSDFKVCAYAAKDAPKGTSTTGNAGAGKVAGFLETVPFAKDYWVVVFYTGEGSGATAAIQKASNTGIRADSIIGGLDCETGLTTQQVGAKEKDTIVLVPFDTEANAKAFASTAGGGTKVLKARNSCGG